MKEAQAVVIALTGLGYLPVDELHGKSALQSCTNATNITAFYSRERSREREIERVFYS